MHCRRRRRHRRRRSFFAVPVRNFLTFALLSLDSFSLCFRIAESKFKNEENFDREIYLFIYLFIYYYAQISCLERNILLYIIRRVYRECSARKVC